MVHGDVTEPGDVERAVNGCEVVFHCVATTQGSKEIQHLVNVEGIRNVLAAALNAGVNRVVYLSTAMVYGATPDDDLDETAPRRYCGNIYADTKLDAEKIVFDYVERHGLPVAVIQPTAVYGPFGGVWTAKVFQQLKTGRVILVNGGDGLRNVVYVDDVVSAILLAAVKEEAVGEAFLISDGQPVTWRDFYARFERMLGTPATVSMSAAEAEAYYDAKRKRKVKSILGETLSILREEPSIRKRILRTREVSTLTKVGRFLLPAQIRQPLKRPVKSTGRTELPQMASEREKPIHPLPPIAVRIYAAKTRICIDKAKRILGYQPAFDFESGMMLTEQWARWANLLDE
jgi:nucleoside-diphosphate-sugar epimerase